MSTTTAGALPLPLLDRVRLPVGAGFSSSSTDEYLTSSSTAGSFPLPLLLELARFPVVAALLGVWISTAKVALLGDETCAAPLEVLVERWDADADDSAGGAGPDRCPERRRGEVAGGCVAGSVAAGTAGGSAAVLAERRGAIGAMLGVVGKVDGGAF